ncbi:hypothetical protein ACU4GD_32915 [Cupriavidus basilensis]
MGLYAEAEDPRWTRSVNAAETDLAVRYALVELNGLPPDWLAPARWRMPTLRIVEQVLGGGEIESELKGRGGDGGWQHSMLLQRLCDTAASGIAPGVGTPLGPVASRPWQEADARPITNSVAEAKLDQVVRVLLVHG